MQSLTFVPRLWTLCAGAAFVAACSATPAVRPVQSMPLSTAEHDSLRAPALVAVDNDTGALESWPIRAGGGSRPQGLSAPLGRGSMVGNGHIVFIANQTPPGVIVYNLSTKSTRTLPDPFGVPVDIAIDKNAVLYVINAASHAGNVTMYPAFSRQPKELTCKYLDIGQAIAVDNEGDIFVNGYGFGSFVGVVEIPIGPGGPQPQNCMKLDLKREPGYIAGLGVDPKTDALIVLDDPDFCAGGIEGRMTIYPKPYQKATAVSHDLGANCAGTLRLSADSSLVFVGDQDVSGSFTFVLQRSYPDGRDMGTYGGGNPGGFTTIPNTLPN